MFLAEFDTPSWTLQAFGEDPDQARTVLERAWVVHARQTGADPTYLGDHLDDVLIIEIRPGMALRDGEHFALPETGE